MEPEQKTKLRKIALGVFLFLPAILFPFGKIMPENPAGIAKTLFFLAAYLIIGGDVLKEAAENILHGEIFDENFLMSAASIGAFCMGETTEAVAVMLFYEIGEFLEDAAVEKSRDSITAMMDLRPDFANIRRGEALIRVAPESVRVGDVIVVRPGERVPLDGTVSAGDSSLDHSALTGESYPVAVHPGDEVLSGAVNLNGVLEVRVMKAFADSTVSRILELVTNAQEKKSKSEAFMTKFARIYTPAVVGCAALLAVVPPLLFGEPWKMWITRALTFLVVSCPCALVISIPLAFFAGIGAASRSGILVKGSAYLEALSDVKTVVFDKTGTLTKGVFTVIGVFPEKVRKEELLELAAHAEGYSSHPIAVSIREAFGADPDLSRVSDLEEIRGKGISAKFDGKKILVGNTRLMAENGIKTRPCEENGTVIHASIDGEYAGAIVISDVLKEDSVQAIRDLKKLGVTKTVMLTGDKESAAARIAEVTGLDEFHAELMPEDKVSRVEGLMERTEGKLAFVGDGINDAPVLTRADIGIAMGALGSDAAIESADIVLMDDQPSKIAKAIRISRKTLMIVKQNIILAIGIKLLVLILAAFGLTGMWAAVFADVGVCILAILNSVQLSAGSSQQVRTR